MTIRRHRTTPADRTNPQAPALMFPTTPTVAHQPTTVPPVRFCRAPVGAVSRPRPLPPNANVSSWPRCRRRSSPWPPVIRLIRGAVRTRLCNAFHPPTHPHRITAWCCTTTPIQPPKSPRSTFPSHRRTAPGPNPIHRTRGPPRQVPPAEECTHSAPTRARGIRYALPDGARRRRHASVTIHAFGQPHRWSAGGKIRCTCDLSHFGLGDPFGAPSDGAAQEECEEPLPLIRCGLPGAGERIPDDQLVDIGDADDRRGFPRPVQIPARCAVDDGQRTGPRMVNG